MDIEEITFTLTKNYIPEIASVIYKIKNIHLVWDQIAQELLKSPDLLDLLQEFELYEQICKTLEIWISNSGEVVLKFSNLLQVVRKFSQYAYDELKWLGENSENDLIHKIGMIYMTHEEFEKALGLYEEFLVKNLAKFGENHLDSWKIYNNLAVINHQIGHVNEAQVLMEKSLEILDDNFGPNHPISSSGVKNLALIYEDLDQYTETMVFYEKFLQIKEQNGEFNMDCLDVLESLGSIYRDLGDLHGAQECFEKSLQIINEHYGQGEIDSALLYQDLGLVYRKFGHDEKAREYFENSLEIVKSTYGENAIVSVELIRDFENIFENLELLHEAQKYLYKITRNTNSV